MFMVIPDSEELAATIFVQFKVIIILKSQKLFTAHMNLVFTSKCYRGAIPLEIKQCFVSRITALRRRCW